jgi:capsular exopolysaccharide synthesis family protein
VTLRAASDGASNGGTTPKKGALIGGAGGLLLGYALAVLRALADRRVRTPARLREATGLQVLGQVPSVRKLNPPWLSGADRSGPVPDAARRIALQVWPRGTPNGTQVVLVTSPRANTGKTVLAAHLAAAAAEMGLRTVLIDANLRAPAVAARLGLEGSAGLQAVLRDMVPVSDVMAGHGPTGITVLPAGAADPDPSALLASAAMRSALGSLREGFDVVVIDGAPLNPTADALTLASTVDGVIVVVEPRNPLGETAQAVRELTALSARVLGFVLNRSKGDGADAAGFSDPVAPDLRATDSTKLTYDPAS